jgi:NDP-4-keto-2,6-dideoxyhexose 3-C-methyltransferase
LAREAAAGLASLEPFRRFSDHAERARRELLNFLEQARVEGKVVAALGASTKGNTILQYCGLGPSQISAVGEVNPEKFGRFTPGTWIPIVAEEALLAARPNYLLILPWHFHRFFCESPHLRGFNLVFPLPELRVRLAIETA